MIKQGDYVKIYFKNNLQTEGQVDKWSNKEVILKQPNSKDYIFILNIEEAILIHVSSKHISNFNQTEQLTQEFEELKREPPSNLRLEKLAQLRANLNEQERKNFEEKMKNHVPGDIGKVKYGDQFSAFTRTK